MQKKLLAAAVAGALASPLAFAQSSVTIYGAFDLSIQNYRVSGGTTGNTLGSVSKFQVYDQSSRIGFRGEENLGGGLRGWFQAESNMQPDQRANFAVTTSEGLATRNSGVGLTGGWGTVMLGMWDSPMKVAIISSQSTGTIGGLAAHNAAILGNGSSDGGGGGGDTTGTNPQVNGSAATSQWVAGNTAHFHRRLSNTVQYWSPKFGGFDFRFAMTANEEKTNATGSINNNPRLWAASGTYAAGPISAALAFEQHRAFRSTAAVMNPKDRAWLASFGYNFGVANVQITHMNYRFANNGAAGAETDYKRKDWYLGASFPIGPAGSAIKAGYSWTPGSRSCGAALTAAGTCGTNTKSRNITLGYDHAMSKRTSLYVAYGSIRNNSAARYNYNGADIGPNGFNGTISQGQDPRSIAVGMKHTF